MTAPDKQRPPLPAEPLECRQHAEASLGPWAVSDPDRGPLHAIAWALLAIAGELATIRRTMAKGR